MRLCLTECLSKCLNEKIDVAGDQKILCDPLAAVFAKFFSQGGIFCEPFHGAGQLFGIYCLHHESIDAVRHGLGCSGQIIGDDWQ